MRKPETITEKLRYEIKLLGNDIFYARNMKHIKGYSNGLDNLITLKEIVQMPLIEGDKRSFKATRKLKAWDYTECKITKRLESRKHYHLSRREIVIDEVELPGWRDVTPFLFNDPYYKIQGRTVTVSQI